MKKTIVTMLALVWISAAGYAEDVPAQSFALGEVVVTATRTAQSVKATPAAVQVITSKMIKEQGAQTLADVLRYATGLQLTRGRSSVSIRGFDSRFSMILIDGKRLASEIDQNYELERIPRENIERIEIIRGRSVLCMARKHWAASLILSPKNQKLLLGCWILAAVSIAIAAAKMAETGTVLRTIPVNRINFPSEYPDPR